MEIVSTVQNDNLIIFGLIMTMMFKKYLSMPLYGSTKLLISDDNFFWNNGITTICGAIYLTTFHALVNHISQLAEMTEIIINNPCKISKKVCEKCVKIKKQSR